MTREDFHNGILSMTSDIAGNSGIFSQPYWFASARQENGIVGCALFANPDGLLISDMPREAVRQVFHYAKDVLPSRTRVTAPPNIGEQFASYWTSNSSHTARIETHWNIYRLDEVRQPEHKNRGRLRLCSRDDTTLLVAWGNRYRAETNTFVDVAAFFLRKMQGKQLFIWDDDGPKAVAAISAPTENGIRISAVFTPEESRGEGYASAMIWELSRKLVDQAYTFVTLSTIAGDEKENLYKRLGYYKIGERNAYELSVQGMV